jgi:tetratricopeptide (TPR) repeat protein
MSSDQAVLEAATLYQAGEIARAERLFGDVLAREPDNFQALKFLGKIFLEKGDCAGAADILSRALRLNPKSPTVCLDLGLAVEMLGRPLEALAYFDQASALRPDLPPAHYNRAGTLRDLGRLEEALAAYDRAIGLQPDFVQAHVNRAVVLEGLGRLDDALAGHDRAIALEPDAARSHYNRGGILRLLKRPAEALASYDRAIALDPDFAAAHANRAVVLEDLKRLDEALAGHDRAIALRPDAATYYNRGSILKDLKRLDEAIASFDRAIALQPDYANAYTNRGFCRLLQGDWTRGLPDYEFRQTNLRLGLDPARQLTPAKLDTLQGKKVLVLYEIGLGDTIQYCRYLPFLAARGAGLLLSVQKTLRALISTLDVPCQFVDSADPALDYDYWVNIISLHYLFHEETKDVLWRAPYLSADPERRSYWQDRLGGEGFKIAVCWRSAGRVEIFSKAFPPSALGGVARLPSVRLISVNKEDVRQEVEGLAIEYLGPDFDAAPDAFADTAAVMKACDLVICCDTAAAHLAGALACPVWVALKYVPDCRWLLDREDTPLYPTMRLFRQAAPDDWDSVFRVMEKELMTMLRA